MALDPKTTIIAVIDPTVTNGWAVMPLANLLAIDDGIADEQIYVFAALGFGETYAVGGGAAPCNYVVSLSHRDAPMHLPNREVACAAYAAFCFFFGMDGEADAHENLTRYLAENEGIPASSLPINWLSAFVDAFDELEA